jgi:hypothetical protein
MHAKQLSGFEPSLLSSEEQVELSLLLRRNKVEVLMGEEEEEVVVAH